MSKITVNKLYKVFGKNVKDALKLSKQGVNKNDILAKTRSIIALQNINMSVEVGTVVAIIGLSGSGKSTLIRTINRLIDPDCGEILIDEINIIKIKIKELEIMRQNKISMVFQHFALFPHRNILQNVAYGLQIKRTANALILEKSEFWLNKVGLWNYRFKYPDELSGGMLQRVGLARAFAVDTEIILMDEPFSALDPIIRNQMQELLVKWQMEYKKTIVFITHDIEEAFKLANTALILKAGTIEQYGTIAEISSKPNTEYVQKFVTAAKLKYK